LNAVEEFDDENKRFDGVKFGKNLCMKFDNFNFS